MKPVISVILPVYNEERTISSIIEIVLAWGKAKEILVVNDGSNDRTVKAVGQFGDKVNLISFPKNRGKGYVMAEGIEKARGDILVFLDGDLVGLTCHDLDIMVSPVVSGKADMVMGIARFWSASIGDTSLEPFNDITGERVVFRKNLLPLAPKMRSVGYGVELLINDYHKNKRVSSIVLPHVYILGKLEKQSVPEATLSYLKEARDMVAQLIRQETGDLTPQAKKIYNSILNYIKSALLYIQE
jgi:glycosyltransferase involved in cell wall biosynthesis